MNATISFLCSKQLPDLARFLRILVTFNAFYCLVHFSMQSKQLEILEIFELHSGIVNLLISKRAINKLMFRGYGSGPN